MTSFLAPEIDHREKARVAKPVANRRESKRESLEGIHENVGHRLADQFYDCEEGDFDGAGSLSHGGSQFEDVGKARYPEHVPLERIETPDWFETPAIIGTNSVNQVDMASMFTQSSADMQQTASRKLSAAEARGSVGDRAAREPAKVTPRGMEACLTEKNTFLDLSPPTLPLRRIVTEPVRGLKEMPSNLQAVDEAEEKNMDCSETRSTAMVSAADTDAAFSTTSLTPSGRVGDRSRAPTSEFSAELSRIVTDDGFGPSSSLGFGAASLQRITTDDGFDRPQQLGGFPLAPDWGGMIGVPMMPQTSASLGPRNSLSKKNKNPLGGYQAADVESGWVGRTVLENKGNKTPYGGFLDADPGSPMVPVRSLPPNELPPDFPEKALAAPPLSPPVVPKARDIPVAKEDVDEALANFRVDAVDRPARLEQTQLENGSTIISWAVDAKKLDSQDKQYVSPQFELRFQGYVAQPFHLIIYPTVNNDGRRGAGFKKAKGKGRLVLKCLSPELPEGFPEIVFSLSIGKGSTLQPVRGPVTHNFSEQNMCGLPKRKEEWDFKAGVDSSRTVCVTLEVTPLTSES